MPNVKKITVDCPTQNCNYEIKVRYITYRIDNAKNPQYVYELDYCEYNNENGCPFASECPIIDMDD